MYNSLETANRKKYCSGSKQSEKNLHSCLFTDFYCFFSWTSHWLNWRNKKNSHKCTTLYLSLNRLNWGVNTRVCAITSHPFDLCWLFILVLRFRNKRLLFCVPVEPKSENFLKCDVKKIEFLTVNKTWHFCIYL